MAESADVNQLIKDGDRVGEALRQAAAAARRQYVGAGLEMPVWRDGRLEWLSVQALQAGEYGASIVAAIAHLEARLRPQLGMTVAAQTRGAPEPMRSVATLVATVRDSGIVPDLDVRHVPTWVQLRDEIVHRGRLATSDEAREIVAGVEDLLGQLAVSSAPAPGGSGRSS